MKNKLAFSIISLFCLVGSVFADQITSGVGLIKPTTGVIDTKRSWADKYNSNFDVIGSTLNTLSLSATALKDKVVVSSNVQNATIESFRTIVSSNIENTTIESFRTIITSNIADGAITTLKILDGTISSDDLGTQQVTNGKIGLKAVTGDRIDDQTISGNLLRRGIVLSTHIANNAISGANLGSSIIRSTHIAGGQVLSIYNGGTFQGLVSSINFTTNLTATVAGGTATVSASGGSGGTTYLSTFTLRLTAGNVDSYLASAPVSSQDTYAFDIDTITIKGITPFCAFTSTVADVIMGLVRTTETANTNVKWLDIDSSSFTVPVNLKWGNINTSPNDISTIYPRETMGLWTTMTPSSGTLPANCGLSINYFKWPRP